MRIAKASLVTPGDNQLYGMAAVALSLFVFAYSARFGQVSILAYYGLWLPLVDATEASVVEQLAPLLSQVRAPYLSLHGADPGPGYEAWLRALVPSAEVEIWDGLGHWLHRVEPQRFLGRLREFERAT